MRHQRGDGSASSAGAVSGALPVVDDDVDEAVVEDTAPALDDSMATEGGAEGSVTPVKLDGHNDSLVAVFNAGTPQ